MASSTRGACSTVLSSNSPSSASPTPSGAKTTTTTAQHKRRSHKKSRHGCGSCKRFHVKCDESGPPCGNCVLRQAQCVYPIAKSTRSSPVALAKSTGSSSGSGGEGWVAAPSRGLAPGGGDADRLLELELMHRWSVRTYAGFVSIAEDVHYANMVVPRAALEHDALLAGVMTCAALDLAMASTGTPHELAYARHAMRLYARASAAFGEASRHITAANHHVIVYLGIILIVYHVAFTQIGGRRGQEPTILPQLGGIFSLLCNNGALARRHWDWIWNSPFPMRSHLRVAEDRAPLDVLDPATRAACARLNALNAMLHGGGGGGGGGDDDDDGAPPSSSAPPPDPIRRGTHPHDASHLEAAAEAVVFSLPMAAADPRPAVDAPPADPATYLFYHNAIGVLESLFAEEARGTLKGGCMAFAPMARKYPSAGVQRSEPMELLVLMHWGVLLQMEAAYYWWIGKSGRMLVAECCDALHHTGAFAWEPDCIASVAWARQQVGLPDVSVPPPTLL